MEAFDCVEDLRDRRDQKCLHMSNGTPSPLLPPGRGRRRGRGQRCGSTPRVAEPFRNAEGGEIKRELAGMKRPLFPPGSAAGFC